MYQRYGNGNVRHAGREYALIIYDHKTDSLIAARDPNGIRPLFYGYDVDGNILFASEAKNLTGLVKP